jgi:hypothetical protein
LLIGYYPSDSRRPHLAGLVAKVTLWNRALSQVEVQELMHSQLTGKEPGLVAYWPLDEGSGSVAHDRTGHGHDGRLENGPVWTTPGMSSTR